MQDFVDRHGITFVTANDDDGSVFATFGVLAQPAWAFSDGKGHVEVVSGTLSDDELTERLNSLAAA